MTGWLNFIVLILASFLAVHYYIKSVSPVQLGKRIGEIAYERCRRYRTISRLFMVLLSIQAVMRTK